MGGAAAAIEDGRRDGHLSAGRASKRRETTRVVVLCAFWVLRREYALHGALIERRSTSLAPRRSSPRALLLVMLLRSTFLLLALLGFTDAYNTALLPRASCRSSRGALHALTAAEGDDGQASRVDAILRQLSDAENRDVPKKDESSSSVGARCMSALARLPEARASEAATRIADAPSSGHRLGDPRLRLIDATWCTSAILLHTSLGDLPNQLRP